MGHPRRRRAGRDHELAAHPAHVQPHLARPGRPGADRVADRLGRARDAPQPAASVQRQRLLPPPAQPRVLGLPARLRPFGLLRLGRRRSAGPLQPAVPVRMVAVLRRRLPARARARPGSPCRRRGRRGLRLRALPGDRGRPSPRDLLGRIAARPVPASARLSAGLARTRARGLARLRLAGQPRLHARPAVLLPARPARAARARVLVAGPPHARTGLARRRSGGRQRLDVQPQRAPTASGARWTARVRARGARRHARAADTPAPARGDHHRHRDPRHRRGLSGAPLSTGRKRLPDGEAHDQGSQGLFGRSRSASGRVLGEPRVGLGNRRGTGESPLQERERVLPGRPDPRAGGDRTARGGLHPGPAPRARPGDPDMLDPRARPRADRRRLSLPVALRLCPGLERRARARPDLHPRHALLRAARRRRRTGADRPVGTVGQAPSAPHPARAARRGAPDRFARRRRGAPGQSRRAPAGAGGDRAARARHGPAHRRRARPRLAVLLNGRLLQDPDRREHLRHPRGGRSARRHERLPRPRERREAPLLRRAHRRPAHAGSRPACPPSRAG